MTKCGRYGPHARDFDYSPSTIRESVLRSLERLHTTYLDVVYLHDVEFVCADVSPSAPGTGQYPLAALGEELSPFGLEVGAEGKIVGQGDQRCLDAIAELRKLQAEGLIKHIGISGTNVPTNAPQSSDRPPKGFPLPTLLRIALLVLHTPPYKPLDAVLSYAHLTLQNATFASFVPAFHTRAQVGQVLTASPLGMGLLTASPPKWHPAPEPVHLAAARWVGALPALALGFSFRTARALGAPCLVGLSDLREVHECARVLGELESEESDPTLVEKRKTKEDGVKKLFEECGYLNWSWSSPPVSSP
jgi:D-arabinose 1-dehydrogenase